MVVEVGERLVGTSTAQRVPLAAALAPHTWSLITGRGSLSTHDPEGDALYGVNIAVDPAWQDQGIGRLLYQCRIDLARSLGCRAFVAGARIPGYHRVAAEMTPEAYVEAVVAGQIYDPALLEAAPGGIRGSRGAAGLRSRRRDPGSRGPHRHGILRRRRHALQGPHPVPVPPGARLRHPGPPCVPWRISLPSRPRWRTTWMWVMTTMPMSSCSPSCWPSSC